MSLTENKRALREQAMAARRAAHRAAGSDTAPGTAPGTTEALWRNLYEVLAGLSAIDSNLPNPPPQGGRESWRGGPVSGFWPIGEEIDIRPILDRLGESGAVCCLPVVTGRGEPLIFRAWRPGDALIPGPMGTQTPSEDAAEVTPEFLLMPLLAFDRQGRRLGYGGGYYDRTLRGLRADRAVTAIGIAYAAQEVAAVPTGPGDEALDWIVTEREALRAVHAEA